MRLLATVTDLINHTQNKYTSEEIRTLELQQKKSEKGFRDLGSFIKNCIFDDRIPNINIIIGKSAVIQHDIIDQMSEAGSLCAINFIQTNISFVTEMISVIQASNNSDVDILVITRGGGDIESEAINKPELAEACLNLKPFLITALGHKVNTPLLERIADKKFITQFIAIFNKSQNNYHCSCNCLSWFRNWDFNKMSFNTSCYHCFIFFHYRQTTKLNYCFLKIPQFC